MAQEQKSLILLCWLGLIYGAENEISFSVLELSIPLLEKKITLIIIWLKNIEESRLVTMTTLYSQDTCPSNCSARATYNQSGIIGVLPTETFVYNQPHAGNCIWWNCAISACQSRELKGTPQA